MVTQSRLPPILITRPAEAAARFGAQIMAQWPKARVVLSPLIGPQYIAPDRPKGPFAAVVFTSETGVAGACRAFDRADLPVLAWCVGDRTAQAARAAGFETRSAAGDADALVAAILADPPPGRILHCHGQDVRGNIAERLCSAGIETVSAVVYAQVALPLTDPAAQLLQDVYPVVVPLFSPRSAALFCDECRRINAVAPVLPVVLSPAVAASLDLPGICTVASQPDAAAMISAMANLFAAAAKA